MHSDAIVEREKREGGGSGYLYWLSHADAVEKLESAIGTPTMQAPPDPIPTSPAVETKPEVSKEDPSAYVLKIAELERERDDLRTRIFDLTRTGANRQDKIAALEAKLETSRAEVDAITKQCDEFRHENKSLKSKCSDLQIQLDEFEERQRFEMWFKSRPEFTSQP
ncbi:MAG TPA: hypothetical protein VJS30_21285, partial [Paraburkholderia sp.]|nr:hypothetical protein [Paraburkholderia sp.]